MKTYGEFRPTQFDSKGLGLEDRQDWLVVGLAQNRDSGCLERCNFAVALDLINKAAFGDEGDSVEVHRFGHWGPGWFELILVRPASRAFNEARDVEAALADYPFLDDDRYNEMAQQEADALWAQERQGDRIKYLRSHAGEHEFLSFPDLLGCARGKYFAGDASSYVEP